MKSETWISIYSIC